MGLLAATLPGAVYTLNGTAITSAYQASNALYIGRTTRARFSVFVFTAVGSNLTTITVKLQQRYNDGGAGGFNNTAAVTLPYLDLPSTLDDVVGASQPKGSTLEIEHAFTVAANNTPGVNFGFYLDRPTALIDVIVNIKANTDGITNDQVIIYANAA